MAAGIACPSAARLPLKKPLPNQDAGQRNQIDLGEYCTNPSRLMGTPAANFELPPPTLSRVPMSPGCYQGNSHDLLRAVANGRCMSS